MDFYNRNENDNNDKKTKRSSSSTNILFYGIIGLIVIIIVYLLWQMLFSNKNILLDSNITLNAGENYQLKVKEGYQIFYTSNNPNVVMVTDDGTIYAMNIGNAIITAKTTDGKSSNCKVTVKDVLVTDITLDQDNINLNKGDVTVLKATITPSDATRKNITWTSSDTNIVTVTNGRLKALSGGTAIITASTTDGKEATCNVTVTVPVVSIKLNETNVSLNKGEKTTLTATITPSDATNQTITWVSSDTSVVTVTDGKLEAKKYGTATITAKSSNGKEVTCTVNVKIPTEGIKLDRNELELSKNGTTTLTATITPNDANDKITWISSDTSVVTVTNGKLKGIKAGTATITAKTSNGKTATCKVTVKDTIVVESIKLNTTNVSLNRGDSATLTATITPSNASNKNITWTSSDTSIVTVTNGKLNAKKVGTATITAKTTNGKTATCKITVNNSTYNRTAIFFGDSITQGNDNGSLGYSWANYIGESYDLAKTVNAGISGGVISNNRSGYWIVDVVKQHKGESYDYIILHGGINDISMTQDRNIEIGSMEANNFSGNYNDKTLIGGLETYLYTVKQQWPNAKIGYIINYNTPGCADCAKYAPERYPKMMEVLRKWKISYINLYSGKPANSESFSNLLKVNTKEYLWDYVHLTKEGYKIISPYIYEWMKGI